VCLVNCFHNTDVGRKFLPGRGKPRDWHSSNYGDFRFWHKADMLLPHNSDWWLRL
jgi:hypothetical protein